MQKKNYVDEDTKEESYKVWAKIITIGFLVFLIWFFLLRTRDAVDIFDPSSKNGVVVELATKYYVEELNLEKNSPSLSEFEIDWETIEYGFYSAVATSLVKTGTENTSYVTTWEYTLRWDSMELKDVYYKDKHYEVE